METSSPPEIVGSSANPVSPREQLSQLFGSYRAEWLREQVFDLFTEPAYFPELKMARPCILVGGRGTGKTTVLRCLSYEGQFALSGRDPSLISSWPYYGVYYRVNTNRVTAFKGLELPSDLWTRVFAHYFNFLMCHLVLRFLGWFEGLCPGKCDLSEQACMDVSLSLNLSPSRTLEELTRSVDAGRVDLEARINNIGDDKDRIRLSLQGAPIDTLLDAVTSLPAFKGKSFFFLIDEYENFEDYQQQVVNTLIKHSGQSYTFKVGVRELGWRQRTTLNSNEQLVTPADYVRIGIADELKDEKFSSFALQVCNSRISKVDLGKKGLPDITECLPGMSENKEAEALGVSPFADTVRSELMKVASKDSRSQIKTMSPLELYFIDFWARGHGCSRLEVWKGYLKQPKRWQTRYDNYKHALLYTIRKRKVGVRKYYAGWSVFVQLAAGNIRYLLELVEQSLLFSLGEEHDLADPVLPEIQTNAAIYVARKNLKDLEGLSVHGSRLTKLLLGLGRIFEVMAQQAEGHAPEVNQFYLIGTDSLSDPPNVQESDADGLLRAAVMHLALLRWSGNKLIDDRATRDYDYMMHPIFAPFFIFSYRKKRKMPISAKELLGLVHQPKSTIARILSRQKRSLDTPLPAQLAFFQEYYGENDAASENS